MKKNMVFFFLSMFLIIFSEDSFARRKRTAMPEEGYWVIESNVNTPKQNTVCFYNNSQQLIGKREFNGKKLNVSRRKVVKQLNGMLFQSITAWHQKEADKNDTMLARKE